MKSNQDISHLINELSTIQADVCMSIYSPLDYDSPDALTANKIRIKNIIGEIKKLHSNSDSMNIKDLQKHIKKLEGLMNNPAQLWKRDAKSLAVFACNDFIKYQFLPVEQEQKQVVVSNSFLVEPLRKLVSDNHSFYVLSASHDGVALFYGDKFHMQPVELDALPSTSAEETVGIDEYPTSLQYHPTTTPKGKAGKGKYSNQFHGQYNSVEVDRNIMIKYFRTVNTVVANYLKTKKKPLIFAGVNYLFPLYEQVNSYKHLAKRPVEGNFQHGDLRELHSRVLSLV